MAGFLPMVNALSRRILYSGQTSWLKYGAELHMGAIASMHGGGILNLELVKCMFEIWAGGYNKATMAITTKLRGHVTNGRRADIYGDHVL